MNHLLQTLCRGRSCVLLARSPIVGVTNSTRSTYRTLLKMWLIRQDGLYRGPKVVIEEELAKW